MSFTAVTALSDDDDGTEHTPAPIPSPAPTGLESKGAAKAKAKVKAKAKPRGRPKQITVKKTPKSKSSTKKPRKKPGVSEVEPSKHDTEEPQETEEKAEEKVEKKMEKKAEKKTPMKRPASAPSSRSTEDPPVMKRPSGKTKEFTVCKYKYREQGAWGFKWDGKERLRVPRLLLAVCHFWNQRLILQQFHVNWNEETCITLFDLSYLETLTLLMMMKLRSPNLCCKFQLSFMHWPSY